MQKCVICRDHYHFSRWSIRLYANQFFTIHKLTFFSFKSTTTTIEYMIGDAATAMITFNVGHHQIDRFIIDPGRNNNNNLWYNRTMWSVFFSFFFLICLIDQQVGEKKETRKLNSIWIFFLYEWMNDNFGGDDSVYEWESEKWGGEKNWNKMQTNFKNQKSNDDGIENFHMLNAR